MCRYGLEAQKSMKRSQNNQKMAKMLDQVHCAPRSGHFLPILTPPIDSTVKNTTRVSLDIQCSYPIYVYSLTNET